MAFIEAMQHIAVCNRHIFGFVDEQKLIKGCLEDNREAQKQLYQQYAGKMLGVCYRYAGSLEEAQDLLQDGFVKVFTNLKKFRGEGSFEGWIRRIMVHTAITYLKRKKLFSDYAADYRQEHDSSCNGLNEMDARELMEEIRSLPPGYRAVFNLYAIEGYSHKEIGDMLHINESTSRSQYNRARTVLMKKITDKLPQKNHG
jgi:RNA polymerase sigma factor (sigma-70 family)